MKKLFVFLALILITSLALPESVTREFDSRCTTELTYGSNIILVRVRGVTLDTIMNEMFFQRLHGTLKKYPPATVDYLINIIIIVYEQHEVYTSKGAFDALHDIESMCLSRLETIVNKKPEDITT